MPTSAPSITGPVAIVELTRPVTESIPQTEVIDIQTEVAETYGVEPEEVTIDVIYQATGSVSLDITDPNISEEELAEALEEEIAALLGIHSGEVEVVIEDGVAFYTVSSDSAEAAQSMSDALSEPTSTATLDAAISEDFEVVVSGVNSDPEINAEVVVTVDTSGAENNLNDAAETLEESFADQGYTAEAESNILSITKKTE